MQIMLGVIAMNSALGMRDTMAMCVVNHVGGMEKPLCLAPSLLRLTACMGPVTNIHIGTHGPARLMHVLLIP